MTKGPYCGVRLDCLDLHTLTPATIWCTAPPRHPGRPHQALITWTTIEEEPEDAPPAQREPGFAGHSR